MIYKCPVCADDNLLSDECSFTPSGNIRACKKCYNKYKKAINKRNYQLKYNKDWHKYYHLFRKYNLTREQFESKLQLQLNACVICKQEFDESKRISVDHNHQTNVVRDLLCYKCNSILGLLNDDEDLVWNVLEYIKRHNELKVA